MRAAAGPQYRSERAVGQPTRSDGLLRQLPSASPRTLHLRSWRLEDHKDPSLQKSRTQFERSLCDRYLETDSIGSAPTLPSSGAGILTAFGHLPNHRWSRARLGPVRVGSEWATVSGASRPESVIFGHVEPTVVVGGHVVEGISDHGQVRKPDRSLTAGEGAALPSLPGLWDPDHGGLVAEGGRSVPGLDLLPRSPCPSRGPLRNSRPPDDRSTVGDTCP